MQLDPQGVAPDDLSHAGSIVDKAIEYMMDQKVAPISAASALLGGALGLLARSMDDRAIAATSSLMNSRSTFCLTARIASRAWGCCASPDSYCS